MNCRWELSQNKATYILRYFLPRQPYVSNEMTSKRLKELITFCKRTHIGAVQFYVNLKDDWYYMPDTAEHAIEWAEEMREFIPYIKEAGISYQINFQNLIGATTGGADHRKDLDWEYLVNHQGVESPGCACPLGAKFRLIMGMQLKAWAETKPDVIWIDDDFRLHNHGLGQNELDWYCYCSNHLEKFSSVYGKSLSRECLIEEIVKSAEVRNTWLDFLNDTMCETASWVCNQIHKISPFTRIALMTSIPDVHAVEGRNWKNLLRSISGDGYIPIVRPHFGPYTEISPADFVNSYLMLDQTIASIGSQIEERIDYCPEIENTRFTRWAKSAAATEFQLTLGQLAGCCGITLSLYDLEGSSLDEEPLYGSLLEDKKDYLDSLAALKLNDWKAKGAAMLADPDSARKVQVIDPQNSSIGDLMSAERTWDPVFLLMGVPARYVQVSRASDENLILLDGLTAWLPDDSELNKMLSKGVLLDSKAAWILEKRGYGDMIGVSVGDIFHCQSSAEVFHGLILNGMEAKRMPLRIPGGNWSKLVPSPNAKVLTSVINPIGEMQPGTVLFENTLGGRIATYSGFGNLAGYDFFNHQRVSWSSALLDWLSYGNFPLHVQAEQKMLTVRRDSENGILLAFANLAADSIKKIKGKIRSVNKFESVSKLCADGIWRELENKFFYESGNGEYTFDIPEKLHIYDWLVLLIK